mgnify:FL=1
MKTTFIYRLVYRLILWASAVYFLTTTAGRFFALSLVVALFYFVARFILALVWRLFVGIVFVLIIILLIL